jgi:ribosomal protein S18 acetylase RimI-like enzyme
VSAAVGHGWRAVRRPSLDDLEAILALMNDPASVHNRTECRHQAAPERAGELWDRLREDENLVLEEDGALVAYASWQAFERHVHLNVMAVSGRRQRTGYGTALFEAFVAAARRDGARGFTLRAYADSAWAIAFYERQGMRRLETRADWADADEGLRRYVALAIEHGQWPSPEKVLFYRRL